MEHQEHQEQEHHHQPGESGRESSPENLPPVEAGTGTESAIAAAGEALNQVKSQEVQALAEVLTRLLEMEQKQQQKLDQLDGAISAILEMQAQAAVALAEIQQQKEALKNPPNQHHHHHQEKTGIRRVLNP